MADFVLVDGDTVLFLPAFGAAMVAVQPGKLQGSGKATLSGKKVCLKGDEANVQVPGCSYISGPHVIPGVGTLKISGLAGDQVAKKTKNDQALMLKGSMFNAEFQVTAPAQQPTPTGPVPDGTAKYSGNGQFITTNMKWKAT